MPSGVFAAIFDLDGVLTSTSVRHEQSWAEAAERFGIPVSEAALRATRSVPRASALSALLAHADADLSPAGRDRLMAYKNERYHALIEGLTPDDAFPGAFEALAACRRLGMKIGVASASLNAPVVLERIGLAGLVAFVADPRQAEPKPSPEIYGIACAGLGAMPQHAACVEDGEPMIANLRAEGMYTVGIGDSPLGADEQFTAIAGWNAGATLEMLKRRTV
jgi:beta-phosphoglucomutase